MYYISKRLEIAGAHQLKLDYESPCQRLHGHNWIIVVHCKSVVLDDNGMVIDFKHIKNAVSKWDHHCINDLVPFNPTAENMAKYLCDNIPYCYKVEVQEAEGNIAIYEVDEVSADEG